MWLGYSYYKTGDFSSSINALNESLQRSPSPSAYNLLALIYRQQKDWAAERTTLENQLRLDSTQGEDAHAHYRLGLLLTVLEPEQALPNLMLASSLNPQFDSAVQTLRAALNLSATQPDEAQKMLTIGRALGLVQEWDLSIVAFENAIKLNAENAEAWAWLGEAKQQTGQDGRAELDQAAVLDHTSVIVRALRGLYWNRQKKYPQMLAEYLLAAKYEPTNPAWQAEIGNAYTLSGDLAVALTAYQQAVELAPNDATYWRLLAVFCSENGVHLDDIGLPAAQKAVELAPDDPFALDTLGWSYLSTGRFANAEQTLLDVTKRYPNHFPAHIHLALTYLAQGNRAAAFNELTYVRDADVGGSSGLFAAQLLSKYFP
jgi:tetratricopeptide (TPR) repeat protein